MNTKIKILIVEDNLNDVDLLHYELRKSGIEYESEVVQNELTFTNALNSFVPDIILSDYSLPSFNGIMAFQIKEKIAADTPFILISGTIGEQNAVELIKNGVTDYLLKDKLFGLTPKIKRALEEAKERKEKKIINEKLQKATHLYAFISQINQNIVRVKDKVTLFRNSCELAIEFGKFKVSWIGLFDQENERITLVEQCGIANKDLKLFSNAPFTSNGPQEHILKTGKYYICNDIENEPVLNTWRSFATEYGIRSLLVLPIKKAGNIIGTFNLYSTQLNFSEKEEIALLEEATGDISFAIDLFEKEKIHNEAQVLLTKNESQKEFDESNLNALINNTKDLMWSVDREFNLITFNEPFNEVISLMFGKKIKKGENSFGQMLTQEQITRYRKFYERAFAGEIFSELEFSITPFEIYSEISFYPIKKGLEIVGVACHSRDITEIKRTERHLQESEVFSRGVLNSLDSHIAVLDEFGKIIAVNDHWKLFALQNGEATLQRTGIGSNYFNVCLNSSKDGEKSADEALLGMKNVLKEKMKYFYMQYPCHSPSKKRWFEMRVMKFDSDKPQIVVAHTDISTLKKNEREILQKNEELKKLTSYLQQVREEERTIIAREIHDELGQQVTALKMDIDWVRHKRDDADEAIVSKLDQMSRMSNELITTIRRISSDLRPAIIDDFGLIAALEWKCKDFEEKTGITCSFDSTVEERKFANEFSINVYRILQETLTNVSRHAEAKTVTVSVSEGKTKFVLEIIDDGKGIDDNDISNGNTLGILGMKERAILLGGKLVLKGEKGKGTLTTLVLPL